jgi:hypothetical protein
MGGPLIAKFSEDNLYHRFVRHSGRVREGRNPEIRENWICRIRGNE